MGASKRPYDGINEGNLFGARRNHIIGIGINDYKYSSNIEFCQSDVENFIQVILEHYDGFEDSWITRIYSNPQNQPTKTFILDTIKNKITCLSHNDNVIIYLSGHGICDDKMFYFAIYNSNGNDLKSFISFDEILKKIDNEYVQHFIFIVDSCYSGKILNIHRNFESGKLEENSEFWKRVYNKKSVWVLTSGDIETVLQNSPFSDVMLKVLKSFGRNEKPILLSELKLNILLYFSSKIKQTPSLGRLNNVKGYDETGGEFVFFPRPIKKRSEEPNIEDNENRDKKDESPEPVIPDSSFPKNKPYFQPSVDNEPKQKIPKFELPTHIKKPSTKTKFSIPKWVLVPLLVLLIGFIIYVVDIRDMDVPSDKGTHISTSTNIGLGSDLPVPPQIDPQNPINIDTSKPIIPPKTRPSKFVEDSLRPYDETTLSSNLVFVGSFNNKENAQAILEKLKTIGYEDAEIVMKENTPYAVVISGFYQFKSSAKAEVRALKKRGFEVYSTKTDLIGIYRNKERSR